MSLTPNPLWVPLLRARQHLREREVRQKWDLLAAGLLAKFSWTAAYTAVVQGGEVAGLQLLNHARGAWWSLIRRQLEPEAQRSQELRRTLAAAHRDLGSIRRE